MPLIASTVTLIIFGVNCQGDNWWNQPGCWFTAWAIKTNASKIENIKKMMRCERLKRSNTKRSVDVCKSSVVFSIKWREKQVIIPDNTVVQFKNSKIIFIWLTYSRLTRISCLIHLRYGVRDTAVLWHALRRRWSRREKYLAYPREIVW